MARHYNPARHASQGRWEVRDMAEYQTSENHSIQPAGTQTRAVVERRIGQSLRAACGKTVRPGGGIVLEYGAGGRVHKECFKNEQKSLVSEV